MTGRIFEGVRIIELAQYVFVPGASALLVDQGAEVIKIETIDGGDPYRSLKVHDGREIGTVNLAMELNNHGKKSIALDLKSEEGRELLLTLLETADVFLTSLRPQALDRLRLGVDDVRARNPRLIYARGNGLGFKGEEAGKAGFDASAFWARGGFAHLLTRPDAKHPTRSRPALGDHAGSVSMAMGIAGALFRRERTGEATVVETSLLANAMWILSGDITYSQAPAFDEHAYMSQEDRFPLMTAYRTRDNRWIQLMLLAPDAFWPGLCTMLDLHECLDDPRFTTGQARMENGPELAAMIRARIAEHDWAHWQPLFEAWNAPWELVRSIREVAADPQAIANGMVYDMALDDGVHVRLVAGPVAFDGQAAPPHPRPAPAYGEHTEAILTAAGITAEQQVALRERGVVR